MIAEHIELAAQLIQQAHHVVAFTGAGISTPSGIPDFRSEKSGLWEQVDPLDVASIHGFRRNPQAFYRWVRPLLLTTAHAQPNPAHEALAFLEQAGKLRSIITQNIDMLHTRAGNREVYELHGHMREATCIQCYKTYDATPIISQVIATSEVPHCTACGGVLKPNVILFGEQLPYQALQKAKDAARACDLMMVIGSSLEVAPASDLPILAQRTGAKLVIINLEPTVLDRYADLRLYGDAAQLLPAIMHCLETLA